MYGTHDIFLTSSSHLLVLIKSTWRDPGSYLLVFLSCWSRLEKIQYLVSSSWSRHDEIHDLVFPSSRPDDVDLKLVFSSFHPHKVDLTRSRILSSCLLVKIKSTRLDPISRLLVFPSSWYGSLKVPPEDEINQEARTRRRDEKTRKWVKKTRRWDEKTKRRDPRSRQVDFVGTRRQKDEIVDLVKSTWLGREDKTRSWISWSWLHEEEKTRRRDTGSRQVDFIRIRRQ